MVSGTAADADADAVVPRPICRAFSRETWPPYSLPLPPPLPPLRHLGTRKQNRQNRKFSVSPVHWTLGIISIDAVGGAWTWLIVLSAPFKQEVRQRQRTRGVLFFNLSVLIGISICLNYHIIIYCNLTNYKCSRI